ncbi:dynein light chain Tctex-type protein 2B-like [Patiria miniata]|uniref:Uncharacterized protein n=1 Tax=Patiria miniata TaxID=46514 RepID=A0A914B253_PATMI|nr:dynein light chain Tctex-type protein 2B-like [Patiria miniata]
MDTVGKSSGATRSSRSSSFLSQGSGSIFRPRETNPFRKQLSGGSSKWTATLQAATAALAGRGSDRSAAQEASSSGKTGPMAWTEDDPSITSRPRRETLYFGKGISTSMWWRFRREGAEPDSNPVGDTGEEAPKLRYENSYRVEPKPGCHFRPDKVEAIMNAVLEGEFRGKEYAPADGPTVVKRLSEEIKNRVKLLGFKRYRLVVFVQVGSIEGADMMAISRCAWNTETDCYATVTFQNGLVYAIATTFGIYLD